MIDWFALTASFAWVFGLALLLTISGFVRFQAGQTHSKFAVILREYSWQKATSIGLFLVSLGLAASAASWVESAFWVFLSVLSLGAALYWIINGRR
ncbi:MAG: hypothetical protein OEZ02_12460 [Anaerolineae bacterium]|nr:hypothetical protein [Anaerolineae bacterium]